MNIMKVKRTALCGVCLVLQYKALPIWCRSLTERWADFPELLVEACCRGGL